MNIRDVNTFGVEPGQLDLAAQRAEGLTIISHRASLGTRALGAWTAIFGRGLASLLARCQTDRPSKP